MKDEFTRFEHEGWERVADKYDSVWSSLTRQFIPHLIDRQYWMSRADPGVAHLVVVAKAQK